MRVAAIEKDEDKLFRILGAGGQRGSIGSSGMRTATSSWRILMETGR